MDRKLCAVFFGPIVVFLSLNPMPFALRAVLSPSRVPSLWAAPRAGLVRWTGRLLGIAAVTGLTACLGTPGKPSVQTPEHFNSVATYSRLFDAPPAQTCEAARRALLSQGYLIQQGRPEEVEGRKNFQPDPESHLQMMIRVVCVPEGREQRLSLGFVTALQDRYTLKKSNSSASVGVGVGSVSLPFMGSTDSMVKVGSETIAADSFYDSFFDLVKRYLLSDQAEALELEPEAASSTR